MRLKQTVSSTEDKKKPPLEMSDLSDMINRCDGDVCYVLGAGPSLHGLKISSIWNNTVITVNSSIMLAPWNDKSKVVPDHRYWVSNDSSVMDWSYFWDDVVKKNCNRIIRTSWWPSKAKYDKYDFRYFRIRDTKKDRPLSQYAESKGLLGISSVITAIDLAIMLGCKEINLLGVDHGFVDGKSHFWQFYPNKKQPKRFGSSKPNSQTEQKNVFQKNLECFQLLNEYAKKNKCAIYNCSKESKINIFPFREFKDD